MRTDEQALHDRINLPRFVKRLELSIQETDWSKAKREIWIKAQGMLQQLQHARRLLKNVQLDTVDPTPAQERRYQHFATTLQRLEDYMRQVEHQLTPPVQRPKPLLPSIPPPSPKPKSPPAKFVDPPVEATLIPLEPSPTVQDLLPATPSIPIPGPSTLPTLSAPTLSTPLPTPTILQNSRALQDNLSTQLAQMATQLRLNATHFSASLQKDKSVIETMQEKVEGNFEFMKRERTRLRDFRGKSGGTTCLVIMSVIVVLIAFILMVFVIRLT